MKLRLVVMDKDWVDYAAHFEQAVLRLGHQCELIRIPYFRLSDFSPRRLAEMRSLVRRGRNESLTIYSPGIGDFFLREAPFSLHFSAFQSWFDAERMRVLPHPWTTAEPVDPDAQLWRGKPSPTIGFMGSAYFNSKVARAAMRAPQRVRRYVLEGRHMRSPDLLALLCLARVPVRFIGAFPRIEALCQIQSEPQVEIVDTGGFTGSEEQKRQYARHMAETTYVLCPRGSENFSFRAYEALKFGRVPVIIDTDMVLPKEIDWGELAIVLPYDRLNSLRDVIMNDYETHSAIDFADRQRRAVETMRRLATNDWIAAAFGEIIDQTHKRD